MRKLKCQMCGEPFTARRRDAKTCGVRCRVARHRVPPSRSKHGWVIKPKVRPEKLPDVDTYAAKMITMLENFSWKQIDAVAEYRGQVGPARIERLTKALRAVAKGYNDRADAAAGIPVGLPDVLKLLLVP